MVYDERDHSIGFCEGGVWFYLSDVASEAGVTEDKVADWLNEFNNDVYVNECLVDKAIQLMAELYHRDRG